MGLSRRALLKGAGAFAAMNTVQALVVLTDPILFSQRTRIVDLAGKKRLPAMYFFQGFVEEGGLMSYGPSDTDLFRRAAAYVDKILKGARNVEWSVAWRITLNRARPRKWT